MYMLDNTSGNDLESNYSIENNSIMTTMVFVVIIVRIGVRVEIGPLIFNSITIVFIGNDMEIAETKHIAGSIKFSIPKNEISYIFSIGLLGDPSQSVSLIN